jgi:putative FmdB family regulatory protein
MPLYEYHCDACGTFSALRKMADAKLPAVCDHCGGESPRIISAPHFALVGQSQRIAYERNEKSAHEPASMRRSSCGCSKGGHTCKTGDSAKSTSNQSAGYQMQTKKTARPWMLSH